MEKIELSAISQPLEENFSNILKSIYEIDNYTVLSPEQETRLQ